MRLDDSDDESAFRAELRAWLRAHVPAPAAGPPQPWPEEELRQWSATLGKAGYAGLTWPREHGGRGLPPVYQAIYAEESTLAGAPDHVNVIGLHMVGPTLIRYGTAAQQAADLPRILSGEVVYCQGFSEPDAGSDLAAVRTRATRTPHGWTVTGAKVWSSYAHLADRCLLLARTEPDAPRHRALTCFLLDMDAPGVEVRPLRQISGDTDFSEIVLNGVTLPPDRVLGTPGEGWRVALTTLSHERGTFGITLTARLTVQLDRLVRTAHAVGATGDPAVRREIADLHVQLQGLRFTGYRALAALGRDGEPGPESSVLKLRWSQAHQQLCRLGLRLVQGDTAGHAGAWAAYWRRAQLRSRANTVEGGTSEILRGIVAERVLGLPRHR
jgi:alkylation response protein AidB-like acyl-CoA dehydrogenase